MTFFSVFIGMTCQDFIMNFFNSALVNFMKEFISFFSRRLYFDLILFSILTGAFLVIAYVKFFKLFDRAILEKLGPFLVAQLLYKISYKLNSLQAGLFSNYVFLFILLILAAGFLFFFLNNGLFFVVLFYLCLFVSLFFI